MRHLSRCLFLQHLVTKTIAGSESTGTHNPLQNYCLYRQAVLLAKCYKVTFKITNVKKTVRSLEGHSATKRFCVSPCKALRIQYILRPAFYKTKTAARVDLLVQRVPIKLLPFFILSSNASPKVLLSDVQRPLVPLKGIVLQKLRSISLRGTASPNNLQSACHNTKPAARVKLCMTDYLYYLLSAGEGWLSLLLPGTTSFKFVSLSLGGSQS